LIEVDTPEDVRIAIRLGTEVTAAGVIGPLKLSDWDCEHTTMTGGLGPTDTDADADGVTSSIPGPVGPGPLSIDFWSTFAFVDEPSRFVIGGNSRSFSRFSARSINRFG
jgi:hypothetical protein